MAERRDMKLDRFGIPLLQHAAKNSYRANPVLEKLQAYTQKNVDRSMMLGNPEELQLLANIARSMGAKKAIDVGVYTGSSSLVMAQALPEDGKVVACDVSEEYTNVGKQYWKEAGVAHKIDVRIAPAKDTLESLVAACEEGTYDFAFIDADKPSYIDYYELCLKLVRVGGVIAVDNTVCGGKVIDESAQDPITIAIREFNEKVRLDDRVSPNQLLIGDGTTLVFKL